MTLLESLCCWAGDARDVRVAAVFGSHARALSGESEQADRWSDVDLEIVTSDPAIYETPDWARTVPGQQLHAYAIRAVFGGAKKITALFSGGEADFVIIGYRRLRLARLLFEMGLHSHFPAVFRGLGEFALVMSFGHKVIKGGRGWKRFYARAVREIPLKHLADDEAVSLADGAYVDAVSIMNKLRRGELVAAQRWLHRSIIEANLQILNEIRVRQRLATYPDGRRVEHLLSPESLKDVRFETSLEASSLRETTLNAIDATRRLVRELTGREPGWPKIN